MKRTHFHKRLLTAAAASVSLGLLAAARTAEAVPVNAQYVEDTRCDQVPTQFLSHELGQTGFFPINEALEISVQPTTVTVCVPNDGVANDWIVQITNISGQAWRNLFFVADAGATLGNADGSARDLAGAPNVLTDAMRIDGTVTPGINNNLLLESAIPDEILQPGETWRFNVSNYVDYPVGGAPVPPIFILPGRFAGSEPLGVSNGTASILAVPVPEPLIGGALVVGAAALALRRPIARR